MVHIGSFSKTLAPALRVGYAVSEWPVLSRMIACKTDSGTGALDQMIVAEYFSKFFDKHVGALSGVLKEKLDTMIEAVEREFGTPPVEAEGRHLPAARPRTASMCGSW